MMLLDQPVSRARIASLVAPVTKAACYLEVHGGEPGVCDLNLGFHVNVDESGHANLDGALAEILARHEVQMPTAEPWCRGSQGIFLVLEDVLGRAAGRAPRGAPAPYYHTLRTAQEAAADAWSRARAPATLAARVRAIAGEAVSAAQIERVVAFYLAAGRPPGRIDVGVMRSRRHVPVKLAIHLPLSMPSAERAATCDAAFRGVARHMGSLLRDLVLDTEHGRDVSVISAEFGGGGVTRVAAEVPWVADALLQSLLAKRRAPLQVRAAGLAEVASRLARIPALAPFTGDLAWAAGWLASHETDKPEYGWIKLIERDGEIAPPKFYFQYNLT